MPSELVIKAPSLISMAGTLFALIALMLSITNRYVLLLAYLMAACLTHAADLEQPAGSLLRFPEGFKWCVATSAHQIEGENTASDWWTWEHQSGNIANGDVSGIADDHWDRVSEDITLLKSLNVTDYRLSIEWAKIEPREGVFDAIAIQHYKSEIQALQAQGIRPIITLQHFTFPQWVREKGAWEWSGFISAFSHFASIVYLDIAPGVRDWLTINEPTVTVINGYIQGTNPPGEKRNMRDIVPVIRGLLLAHASAYHLLHRLAAENGYEIRVGMAHHLRPMVPANPFSILDRFVTSQADGVWNWAIPDALESGHLRMNIFSVLHIDEEIPDLIQTQDFIAINYYSTDAIRFSLKTGLKIEKRKKFAKTDMGWSIYPKGLYQILKKTALRYRGKSILISENGLADSSDRQRPDFIRDHLLEVNHAISENIPVEGYCHWSLFDNFEWADGFVPRFGLFEVDYKTLQRRPRPSALYFAEIARQNAVPLK